MKNKDSDNKFKENNELEYNNKQGKQNLHLKIPRKIQKKQQRHQTILKV